MRIHTEEGINARERLLKERRAEMRMVAMSIIVLMVSLLLLKIKGLR